MGCPFCAIETGAEDALILEKTDETVAFAPLEPVSEGHLLVIPRDHYESVFDVPEPTLAAVVGHAKRIAERLRSDGFDGINLLHASGEAAQQSVAHFHVHLAPRRFEDDLDLWPDSGYKESDFDRTYERVRRALRDEGSQPA